VSIRIRTPLGVLYIKLCVLLQKETIAMRKLLGIIFAVCLWFNFAPSADAAGVAGLTPCSESSAFQQRAATARNTTTDPESGKKRFERYSQALCGPEGLPHLIVDGRLDRAGDFLIPGLMFLYIAGWIGWVGRAYIIAAKKSTNPEEKEIIIDIPLAIASIAQGPLWPLAAFKEFASGELTAKESEVTVSPR
jgi:photosystem I subunit 3